MKTNGKIHSNESTLSSTRKKRNKECYNFENKEKIFINMLPNEMKCLNSESSIV